MSAAEVDRYKDAGGSSYQGNGTPDDGGNSQPPSWVPLPASPPPSLCMATVIWLDPLSLPLLPLGSLVGLASTALAGHPLTLLAEGRGLFGLLGGSVTLVWDLVGKAAGHVELAGVQCGFAEGRHGRVHAGVAVGAAAERGQVQGLVKQKFYNIMYQFSNSIVSNSLQPHELQHARLPCLSPRPGACSNSCPLSR